MFSFRFCVLVLLIGVSFYCVFHDGMSPIGMHTLMCMFQCSYVYCVFEALSDHCGIQMVSDWSVHVHNVYRYMYTHMYIY